MEEIFKKTQLNVAIEGRNLEDLRPLLAHFPCRIVEDNPDLVISHGGDGSLLGAERKYPGVPKCPIRDRRQNPKCPIHGEMDTLSKLFAGKLAATELHKLEISAGKKALTGINDVLVHHTEPTSALRFRIWLDGELFRPQVICDSLLVATPFGSTGYFQSMTHGNLRTGLGMAFNNSLDLLGYTVLPENVVISAELLRGPAVIVADNNPARIHLDSGEMFTVRVLPEKTTLFGIDVFRCQDCFDLRKTGKF
ncbi:MAG: hypothetical protein IKS20_01260 [Victivallales bacterium]|nr:hypothetical protein [Victivallales bacterium]